eukprot:372886_1
MNRMWLLCMVVVLFGSISIKAIDRHEACDISDTYCMEHKHDIGMKWNHFTEDTVHANEYHGKLLNVFETIKEIKRTFGTPKSVRLVESLLPFPGNPLANILFVLVSGIALTATAGWIGFYVGWIIGCQVARKYG